jgi:acyl-CoA thioesterase YciA
MPIPQPVLKVMPRTIHANPKGDIFGGWLMSKIDLAGAIEARNVSDGDVSTVAVQSLQFINPLFAGDLVSFHTETKKIGRSSIVVDITVFAQRQCDCHAEAIEISQAQLVYVAVSGPGEKRLIQAEKT